jgi:tetratricopeptide (TPR) repeat protein
VALAAALLAACAAPGPVVPEPEPEPEPEPVIVRPVVVAERAVDEMVVAMKLLEEGNLRQAEANFEEILKVRPDIPEAHLNLGWVKQRLGKHGDAVSHLREGLRRRPADPRAAVLIALSQREQGQFAEAEATLKQRLAAMPQDDQAHLNLGVLYELYLFRPQEALAHYRQFQALQAVPDARVAGWIAVLERQAVAK